MTYPEKFPPMTRGVRSATFYTITAADVGRATIDAFGRSWLVSGFIGHIGTYDIGKRVYQVGDVLQVENDAQRDERLKK